MPNPHIDPRVIHVRPSWLRLLNSERLKSLPPAAIIHVDEQPVAVVLPYDTFLALQEQAKEVK